MWIPDNIYATKIASQYRRFICGRCGNSVDAIERFESPQTGVSGLKFFCHGETDIMEVSEAMMQSRRIFQIQPFRKWSDKSMPNLDLQFMTASIRPMCDQCGKLVEDVTVARDDSRKEILFRFKCHGEVRVVPVEERTVYSQKSDFWRSMARFSPFPASRRSQNYVDQNGEVIGAVFWNDEANRSVQLAIENSIDRSRRMTKSTSLFSPTTRVDDEEEPKKSPPTADYHLPDHGERKIDLED